MTTSRIVAIDERTGLAVLEPDLFPDETWEIELAPKDISTGESVFVGAVQDGQFNPDNVEVVTSAGRARRLVGRSRTSSRLATDIESRPGSGGAPLLTEDGRLGGIMSARDPGQYIVSRKLEELLRNLENDSQPAEQSETTTVNRPRPAAQGFMPNIASRDGDLHTNPQVLVDTILKLHRELSESAFSLKQSEAELERLKPLASRGLVPESGMLKAQSAREQAINRIELLRQQVSVWQRHSTLSDQYAQASMRVAKAEMENAVAANKKVPGTIPDAELRRMMLRVEQRGLELQLVQQALELLKEAEDELNSDDTAEDENFDSAGSVEEGSGPESGSGLFDSTSGEEGAFEESKGEELPVGIGSTSSGRSETASEDDLAVDPFGSIRESNEETGSSDDDSQPDESGASSN